MDNIQVGNFHHPLKLSIMVGEIFKYHSLNWLKLALKFVHHGWRNVQYQHSEMVKIALRISTMVGEIFENQKSQMAKIALKLSSTFIIFFSFFSFIPPPSRENPDNCGEEKPKYQYIYQYILKIWGFCSTFRSTFPIYVQEVHISTYQYKWPPCP